MGSSYTSPQSSFEGTINSGNSSGSSSGKTKSLANSIAKVFRSKTSSGGSSSQREFSEPLLEHDADFVGSQLQVELKSLIESHENLGAQASSLGAELAQTRAEAEALKVQLEDATSRLTPSPTKASFSPQAPTPTSSLKDSSILGSATPAVQAASYSPEVVGSPFGQVIHEDIVALQAQIDLLTSDISIKDETLKLLEAARAADALTAQAESDCLRALVLKTAEDAKIAEDEAKHCIQQVQDGKEAALVAAATAASDAKKLATRCAALEVTVQHLMEGLENKKVEKSDMEEAVSDCEAKIVVSGDSTTTEVTGPLIENTQDARSIKVLGTIGAIRPHNNNNRAATSAAVLDDGIDAEKRSRLSVAGNGRFNGSKPNTITARGANQGKLVVIKASASSSAGAAAIGGGKKSSNNNNVFIKEILKNDTVKVVVGGAAGLFILGVLSRLVRGSGKGSKHVVKARPSRQPRHHACDAYPGASLVRA